MTTRTCRIQPMEQVFPEVFPNQTKCLHFIKMTTATSGLRKGLYQGDPQKRTDMYFTPPVALDCLLPFLTPYHHVWECASGQNHITNVLRSHGHHVTASDISNGVDFLTCNVPSYTHVIVTNPPFSVKLKFIKRAFELSECYGIPFAFLLPLNIMESVGGRKLLESHDNWGFLLPKKTINYICPDQVTPSRALFYSAWLTNIPGISKLHFT